MQRLAGQLRYRRRLALCALVGLMGGCHGHEKQQAAAPLAPAQPQAVEIGTSAPAATRAATTDWENSAKGVRISYPVNWKAVKSPDYELMLLPPGATGDARRITMDIPDLPPHLPFMIQMGRVEHDYLEDLKKEHPDLKLDESTDAKIPNSTSKRVVSSWHEGNVRHEDIAVLIIHASAVYILDARTDESHLNQTRQTFDSIESSLRWK